MKRLMTMTALLTFALVACPQTPAPIVKPSPILEQPFKPTLLGSLIVELGVDGKGTTAQFKPTGLQNQALNPVADGIMAFSNQILQTIDVPSTTNRYLIARFTVTNNSAVARQNLTLVAYNKNGNTDGSAFTNVQTFAGGSVNVNNLIPVNAMKTSGCTSPATVCVDNANADLQIYQRSEITTLTTASNGSIINVNPVTGEGILQYGYVARSSATSRIIAANGTGTITLALQVPQAGDAGNGNSAYRYSMTFLVFTDNVARVTESTSEQGTNSGASTRATNFGGSPQIATMCGTTLTGSTFIPGVRTVGVGVDTAWMGGNFFDSTGTTLNLTGIVGNTQKTYSGTNGVLNGRFVALGTATLGAAARAISSATTTNGGNIGIATNGNTTILPLVNSRIADGFTYRITDGICTSPNISATIAAPTNTVWYIDSSVVGGDGRSHTPFQTLSSLNVTVPNTTANNDFIYVQGTGTNTATLTMKPGQQLIGSGVALVVGAETLQPAGTAPTIDNPITLNSTAGNNTIRGLTIRSLTGTGFGTLTMNSASIAAGANRAINLTNGALAATLTSVSSSGGAHGIQLTNTTGSLSVTGTGTTAGSGGVLNDNTQDGVNLSTQFGSVTLKNMQIISPANEGVDAEPSTGTNLLRLEDTSIVSPSTSTAATHKGIDYVGSGTSVNTLEVIGTVTVTTGNFSTVASRIQAGDTSGIFVNTVSGSSATMTFKVEKTSFVEHASFAINAIYSSSGATVSTIDDSFMRLNTNISGSGVAIDTNTPTQTHKVRIQNNNMDFVLVNGASTGIELRVRQNALTQAIIANNIMADVGNVGILVFAGSDGANTANAQVTMTNNNMNSTLATVVDGVHILSGAGNTSTGSTVCLNAVGNNSNFDPGSFSSYYLERRTGNTMNLNGLTGSGTSDTNVKNWLLNAPRSNLPNDAARVDLVASGGVTAPGFGSATCTVPTF
jgi:trimeric autotransporter adhesin